MFAVRVLTGADGGGIQALPLSVRAGFFAVLVALALGTLLLGARAQWREGDGDPGEPVDAEHWWRAARVLLPLEAAVGLVALVSAAILGGGPPAPATPAAAATAGPSLLLTTSGAHLVPVALAPGLPGANRVVVGVQDLDADGVAQPAAGVAGVSLRLRCDGCGARATVVRLQPTGAGPWYAGTVTLAAGTWTLTPVVDAPGAAAARPVTTAITPPQAGQLLVGVPADLSGPYGGACQNRALGVELALAGVAGSPAPRVVLDDVVDGGAAAATERLAGRGVHLLAAPCGQAGILGDIASAASALHLPLVGALRSEGDSPWVWRTGIDQGAEGAALARRVQAGGAASALVLVGPRPEQSMEAAAVERGLAAAGVAHQSLALDTSGPAQLAAELARRDPATLVIVASPRRALPLVEAVARGGWRPARGIVASSDLMSVSFVEEAAPLLGRTALSIAGELDPADPTSRDYLAALHRSLPERAPGIEGARGWYDGVLVARAAAGAGRDASPAALEAALRTGFGDVRLGLFELDWATAGGGPDRLAFFRPGAGGLLLRDGPAVTAG